MIIEPVGGQIQVFDLIVRLIIFLFGIPIIIRVLVRFFDTDEFVDFIRYLAFPIYALPLYIYLLIERKFLLRREEQVFARAHKFAIDFSTFEANIAENMSADKIFSLSEMVNTNFSEVRTKSDRLFDTLKRIESYLAREKEQSKKTGFFAWLGGLFSSKTSKENLSDSISTKIARLEKDIENTSKKIQHLKGVIDSNYQGEIANIENHIKILQENRKNEKAFYEKRKAEYQEIIDKTLISIK
ncbi:hypothetical protein KGV55_02220 [Candidatus Gracilibacteria bacterium]|nr:hypothetical protein [Candidatus Gracilibacteria bacterium]